MTAETLTAQSTHANNRSRPPQSDFDKFNTEDRLVWHKFKGFWWPGIFYNDLNQFNSVVLAELDKRGDKPTKAKLAMVLLKRATDATREGADLKRSVIRYLGRPIFDFQQVNDEEYQDFYSFLTEHMMSIMYQPTVFGQDNYDLYMDYHRAVDQSIAILSAEGGNPFGDGDENSEMRAQKSWDEQNWTNVAPPEQHAEIQQETRHEQPQQQSRQPDRRQQQQQPPEPPSPNTNSVAAVSLADESLVSHHTNTTGTHYTETPVRQPETPAASSSSKTPTLEASPFRGSHLPWQQVWSKMCYSDWTVKMTGRGKIYTHPTLAQEFTEGQVQEYAKEHYGWLGERQAPTRTTRSSNPKRDSPSKRTFGVLWKRFLEKEGWTQARGNGKPIEWYYIRPNRSVEGGIAGEDYFISTHDVIEFCENSDKYQSSSGSESDVSPNAREYVRRAMETDDDDESTKMPAETDDDGSTVALTPKEQRTQPQDPAKPQLEESASESESEQGRYEYNGLWSRLHHEEGWKWTGGRNRMDANWYLPPASIEAEKKDRHAWKNWTRGVDYFVTDEELIEYIKMKEGTGVSEEQYMAKIAADSLTSSQRSRRGRAQLSDTTNKQPSKSKGKNAKKRSGPPPKLSLPTPKTAGVGNKVSKEMSRKNKKKESDKTNISSSTADKEEPKKKRKGQKEAEKTKKRTKTSDSSKAAKKLRKSKPVHSGDIDVRFHGESNPAPWAVNPLPAQLHSLLMAVGFKWIRNQYHLPNGSGPGFDSTTKAIQYCATEGNVDFSSASPEARVLMERLIAYANVTEKQSSWSSIRAITTRETIALLNALGYAKVDTGPSWKAPDSMVPLLKQQEFASLDDLILALRRSDTLVPKASRFRHRPEDDVLSKDKMLALRLRIAAGLDDEVPSEESSSDSSSSSEEESVAPSVPENKNQDSKKTRKETGKSEFDFSSEDENAASPDKVSESAAPPEIMDEGEDESTVIEQAVIDLRESIITSKVGWQLLQKAGCRWTGGSYALPNTSERFANQNDLVHYILKTSVMELDLNTNPLPKEELKQLHRYLKFQHVPLKCGESIWKALHNMQDSDMIVNLLEKIGFKQMTNGHFNHKHIDGDFDVPQIINAIRAQREDLMLMGQDGKRVRDKKSLCSEDDYTLRIWAAESDTPIHLFDENTMCKEAIEAQHDMDEDEDRADQVSDDFMRPSEYSNGGDKVLAVEAADASNSGFIDQSTRNQDSSELLSRDTVPVNQKSSVETEAVMQESGSGVVDLLTQPCASNDSEQSEPRDEEMPLSTQEPQEDESENEDDVSRHSSSLYEKAVSRWNSSHSEIATADAAMEDPEDIMEAKLSPGRSKELNMLINGTDEDSMHDDEGEMSRDAMLPLLTQAEED